MLLVCVSGTSIVFDMSLTYILVALLAVILNNVLVERLSMHTRITVGESSTQSSNCKKKNSLYSNTSVINDPIGTSGLIKAECTKQKWKGKIKIHCAKNSPVVFIQKKISPETVFTSDCLSRMFVPPLPLPLPRDVFCNLASLFLHRFCFQASEHFNGSSGC